MRWKNNSGNWFDLAVGPALGLLTLAFSFLGLTPLRWLFGLFFVFLGSGFSAVRLLPKSRRLAQLLLASVISLLMTYPAAILTALAEGQGGEAIFSRHLETSIFFLWLLSLLAGLVFFGLKPLALPGFSRLKKISLLVVFPLVIYSFLVFGRLNRADVYGDEYDLGYQAYDLVDGIKAGRRAYLVSFSDHPPLSKTIKHFSMNLLNPNGLDSLADWQFRVSEGIVGLLTLLALYCLAHESFGRKAAVLALWLAAVNNYLVWLGRIFHREIYLTFFMTVSLYFFLRFLKSRQRTDSLVCGLALGAALLVKETALVLAVSFFLYFVLAGKLKQIPVRLFAVAGLMFLPVIFYNLAAYLTTGYADVFFSVLFGNQRPGGTPALFSPFPNFLSMFSYLGDIFSPPLFALMLISLAFYLLREKSPPGRLLIVWLAVSVVFFAFTAIRPYYFSFMTIPLLVILARVLVRFFRTSKPLLYLSIASIFCYSIVYSAGTNLSRDYSLADRIGMLDGSVTVNRPIFAIHSFSLRPWSEEVGYKRLQQYLDLKLQPGDCLMTDPHFDSLASRRYLGHLDGIKEYYLGENYPRRYRECSQNQKTSSGLFYLTSREVEGEGEPVVVTDHLGNPRFFIYRYANPLVI